MALNLHAEDCGAEGGCRQQEQGYDGLTRASLTLSAWSQGCVVHTSPFHSSSQPLAKLKMCVSLFALIIVLEERSSTNFSH